MEEKTLEREDVDDAVSRARRVEELDRLDRRPIIVSEEDFRAIEKMLEEPLSPEEIEGRKRLEAGRMWDLRSSAEAQF